VPTLWIENVALVAARLVETRLPPPEELPAEPEEDAAVEVEEELVVGVEEELVVDELKRLIFHLDPALVV